MAAFLLNFIFWLWFLYWS